MSVSVLCFTLLVVVPSVVGAVVFSLGKVPLRLSLSQTNLPLQVFLLGVLAPIFPYMFAYYMTGFLWKVSWSTPLFVAIGLFDKTLTVAIVQASGTKWLFFFLFYYLSYVFEIAGLGWFIRHFGVAQRICETLGVLDDQKVAEAWAGDVRIEADIVSNHGGYIYSGWMKSGRSKIFFDGGCIVLRNVVKTKIEDGDKPLIPKNRPEHQLLGEMYFPKSNIVNINLRTQRKMNTKNVNFQD